MKKKSNKKENVLLVNLKKFFNNPVPIVIFLIILNAFLLIYIANYNSKNKIFVGDINREDIQIVNVHYFTNGDMNYFYASNAEYLGEEKEIYSYQIGYYVISDNNEYIELATRSNSLENSSSLKEIIKEMSGWSFAESDQSEYFFNNKVLRYMDNLHFVVKASTTKDNKTADIVIDYPVESTKITK